MSFVILSLLSLVSSILMLFLCTSKKRKVPSITPSRHERAHREHKKEEEQVDITQPSDVEERLPEITPRDNSQEKLEGSKLSKETAKKSQKSSKKSKKLKRSGSKSECRTAKVKSKESSQKSNKMKSSHNVVKTEKSEKSAERTDKSKIDSIQEDKMFFKSQRDDDTLRCVRSIANSTKGTTL